MSDQAQTIAATALQTAVAMAPTLAATDPKVAAILAAASLANTLLQAATAATEAGMLPPEQLVGIYASLGIGIQSTHNAWAAMNAAEAGKS